MEKLLSQTLAEIRKELRNHPEPWVVGFSGGKDSSCVVKLIYLALLGAPDRRNSVTILYCDTGVEIPLVRTFVWQTLTGLSIEAKKNGVPLECNVASPPLRDRFFFKIIGRGYVSPTNKFRWCTDRLRIHPVQSFINKIPGGEKIVVLGLRRGESQERDKTIARHRTKHGNYFRQSGAARTLIYTPILRYSVEDVWNVLANCSPPGSIDCQRLLALYRHANGECPIVRDADATPCAGSRFGCWTCTVVRRDRAMESLIESGYEAMRPLLDFRNWLIHFRDDPKQRWSTRRNGCVGPGPFTIAARRTILRRLLATQQTVGFQLITPEEIVAIKQEWELDRTSEVKA
jgi:DNA sulfur modification protein DndC